MLLQRSKLAAATVERPRLSPPWSITLLGVLVLAVLFAIYPHKALVHRIIEAPQSELTDAYLVNLLRTDSGNPQLRLTLARHELSSGLYDKLELTLAKLLQSPDKEIRLEATWLSWRAAEQRYFRMDPGTPQRAAQRAQLRSTLRTLAAQEWPEDRKIEIARLALQFNDTQLGIELLQRVAASGQGRSADWYAEAARAAMAGSEYLAAGKFYLIAVRRTSEPIEQRRFFIDGMLALQSGDQVKEALALAEEELAVTPSLGESAQVLELLVRFARSVRRPDLADKYARKLLRLSLLRQWKQQQLASAYGIRWQAVGERSGPQLPFDDRIYTLGFEAFLDNRKLEDAWQVAASAVRQAPDHLVWRERLARVSEWTGRPAIALTHWLYLARANGSDEAWQAILRLAPGLFDDKALLAAIEHQVRQQPANPALVAELVATFERLGDPRGAMRVLEQLYRQQKRPELLASMAELAERMGDDERALELWQRFMATNALTTAQAVHVGTLYLLRGEQASALAILERVDDAAESGSANSADTAGTTYWRLRGDIATRLGHDKKAAAAYRHVLAGQGAVASDHQNLATLLLDEYPLEAARVSSDGWLRFRDTHLLLQALGLYATAGRWQEMGKLMRTLSAEETAQLRQQANFLRLSAQYRMANGQRSLALADLDAAFALAAGNVDVQQALLWLLVESGEGKRLRSIMAAHERDWQPDPAMHDVLAAANLALSIPDLALRRYLTPRLAEHRDDFLWLMNYADALEQNQEVDRAWSLRKQLLLDEKRRTRQQVAAEQLPREMAALRQAARARLLMLARPGDPAYATLREMLRLDRAADGQLSPSARDAAFGWLLDAEQYDAARGWLWQQYAKTAARPLWGEMRLALESGDRALSGQLLDDYAPLIPRNDRIEAARLAGDVRLAQSEAFDAQTDLPADDPLHLQLSETLLAHSHHVGGSVWQNDIGSVDERNASIRAHVALSPRLTMDFEMRTITRHNRDPATMGETPNETANSARMVWMHNEGITKLTVAERKSFDTYHPLLIEHEQNLDHRLTASFALGHDQPADESTALRVGGMKDKAAVSLAYHLTRFDRFAVERSYDRFYAQTGAGVGSGHVWRFEYGHALRTEPRNLEASVFWSQHRYSQKSYVNDPQLAPLFPAGGYSPSSVGTFFVPNGFNFKGIRLSTDTNFEEDYTRAWRPYASIARTWHSDEGPGYDLATGIAGSVFGADHLNLGWRLSRGGANTGGLVREFGFNYRLHF
ncbi:MAG: tetratricopeptide repeat protein [Propionivibrio sp.]|uniref:tetratricopeptide repeat protein n=1 Tax=Propionivibrio sp. TaxID=2212460 RepID=UPI0025EBDB08|nr:tetratricopeptide repeat protein [Propionivibrio sp.]MBL0207750.1 tetratricopeptide repeat protein [Propionivibrio sp.]